MIQTLEWTDKGVRFLDQTKLPTEETYVTATTYQQVADVIRNMVVRGAPAIGVAAAMGIALGVQNSKADTAADLKKDFDEICSGRFAVCRESLKLCAYGPCHRSNKRWSKKHNACMRKTSPRTRPWDDTVRR